MKNLKLRTKLLLSFGIIVLILMFIGVRQYIVLNELEDKRTDLSKSYQWADAVMEAKYNIRSDMQLLMEVLETKDEKELNDLWTDHLNIVEDYDAEIEILVDLSQDDTWGHEFESTKVTIQKYADELEEEHNTILLPAFKEVRLVKNQIISDTNNGYVAKAEVILLDLDETIDNASKEMIVDLEELEAEIKTVVDYATNESSRVSARATNESILICIAGLLFAIIITIIITRGITLQLGGEPGEVAEIAKKVSEGDLTIDVKKYGERIGVMNDIKNMVIKLKEIVADIRQGAENIASASQQLSSGSQQLSQGATEQASSAEEVSSSMEEMASNIQQNTDNSQQTEKISLKASQGMENIGNSSNKSLNAIKEISDKITIINDISFQTNILALNAAVEAARAGEHGKGFAVVASEVRKLAERSKIAAEEIVELSRSTVNVTDEARKLIDDILPEIQKTSKLVQEITAASLEQNTGSEQVNNAVQQLSQVTQQNAAAAEEIATSSEELASQADLLNETVAFFKVSTNGEGRKKDILMKSSLEKGRVKDKIHSILKNSDKDSVNTTTQSENNKKKETTDGVTLNIGQGDDKDSNYENF